MKRRGSRRARPAAITVLMFGFLLVMNPLARAASVTPVLYQNTNLFCTAPTQNQTGLGLDEVARFDPASSGEINGVTIVVSEDGKTIESWSSTEPISAVIVKGGPHSNAYLYDPAATSDTNLVAPLNPGGNLPELSHVDFCAGELPELLPASVSVEPAACDFVDGESITPVSVAINPVGGAVVTLTGPGGPFEFTGEGGSEDLLPGEYSWTAVANEGFELMGDAAGAFTADECPPGVLGSGSVSVEAGACVFEEGESRTPVSVTIAPDGAASVSLVGGGQTRTFAGTGGSAVLLAGTYEWTATANEGFELIGATSGTILAEECAVVLGERLAKTGGEHMVGLVGFALLMVGAAIRMRVRHALI